MQDAANEKLESKSAGREDASDITSAKQYSIEQAKLKQEEDDRASTAEKKKEVMRAEIQELRKQFQFLLKQNSSYADLVVSMCAHRELL